MTERGSWGEIITLFLLAAFLAASAGTFTMLLMLWASNLMGADVPVTWLEALVGAVLGLLGGLLLAGVGYGFSVSNPAEQRARIVLSASLLGGALALVAMTICGLLTGPWTLIGH